MLEGVGAGIGRGKRQLLEVSRRSSGEASGQSQLPFVVSLDWPLAQCGAMCCHHLEASAFRLIFVPPQVAFVLTFVLSFRHSPVHARQCTPCACFPHCHGIALH